MEKFWLAHIKRNKGLPEDLNSLMKEVNRWLSDHFPNILKYTEYHPL
jgi:hypothetical protein